MASDQDMEARRLAVLQNLEILDTPPERAFDTIVQATKSLLGCDIALISLVDDHRQWFKAKCGLDASETPREVAFCAHAIRQNDIFLVTDAATDPRFAGHPLVIGPPHVRFYAGVPIRMTGDDGSGIAHAMGTLCVIDWAPRDLDEKQAEILRDLAHVVESLLHARAAARLASRVSEEQREVLVELDRRNRQLNQAEKIAQAGSWRWSLADQTIEWSDGVYVIHELPVTEKPTLERALDFFPPRSRAALSAALARTIEIGEPFDEEVDFVTATGRELRVRSMGEREERDGVPIALLGVFQDITERHALEQRLRRDATIDGLTGLANRARFNEVLDERIGGGGDRAPMALLLIDLDHSKMVNDRHGHLAGDELLGRIGARLRMACSSGCFSARLGGDEFVMLVSDPDALDDLPGFLARLLPQLCEQVGGGAEAIPVSATIGAARLIDTIRDRSDFTHRADLALYDAKRFQRGSARIFGDPRPITAERVPQIGWRQVRR